MSTEVPKPRPDHSHLRRVVIEERQQKTIDHVRSSKGYGEDVGLNAHDQRTFRLINQRKELDELPGADSTWSRSSMMEVLGEDARLGLAQSDARAADGEAP